MSFFEVYDVLNHRTSILYFIPLVVALGSLWLFIGTFRGDMKEHKTLARIIFAVITLVFGYVMKCNVVQIIYDQQYIVEEYEKGNYCVVEGTIENYYNGRQLYFNVDQVEFRFPYRYTCIGYQKTNIIYIKEGNKVRIRYVVDECEEGEFQNIIVHLEVAR
ncbi:MAG: hypothetical protein IJP03_02855 [Christensenellaceae bacterium]|nr:hypothetical protein [Christensenellaceae bacterium]